MITITQLNQLVSEMYLYLYILVEQNFSEGPPATHVHIDAISSVATVTSRLVESF